MPLLVRVDCAVLSEILQQSGRIAERIESGSFPWKDSMSLIGKDIDDRSDLHCSTSRPVKPLLLPEGGGLDRQEVRTCRYCGRHE